MTHSSSSTISVQFFCALFWLLLSTITLAAEEASQPSCACVAQGKRFAQGETACIYGQRMICGMNQNISAWQNAGGACQVSHRVKRNFTKSFTLM